MSSNSVLGKTLLQFSRDGIFPEDENVSAATIETSALPAALYVLREAKDELEVEVRQISRDQPPDVDLWIEHAQGIQDDIRQTKSLASEIIREAEAGDQMIEDMKDKKAHAEFLSREASFNDQLLETLKAIKAADELMDEAQQIAGERKLIEAVNVLKKAELAIDAIGINRTARAKTLLHTRHEDLHFKLHETLSETWGALVRVDHLEGTLCIRHKLDDDEMDLDQAILGLECFNEVDNSIRKFSQQLDDTILRHRTDLHALSGNHSLVSIEVDGEYLKLGKQHVDRNVESLFRDLEVIIKYLSDNLPDRFAKRLADAIMPPLADRIEQDWLRTCIPVSLESMTEYQKVLTCVSNFATMLDEKHIAGSAPFHEWVQGASKNWLSKKRDDAMDYVRDKLSRGIGEPKPAIHVEKAMVTKDESLQLGLNQQNGNSTKEADEWAAWGSDEEDEAEQPPRSLSPDMGRVQTEAGEGVDDDIADSWGDAWDIDDVAQEPDLEPQSAAQLSTTRRPSMKPKEKEFSLSETYKVSSIPDHVVQTIKRVLEDGVTLSEEENSALPVAPAAMGLFNLPALILAMYRSVSPLCYGADERMYLYTDSIYMADELKDYGTKWLTREDIPARAQKRMKLDADIKTLETFGKRAYVDVMNLHKTVIKDLMGGAQNFLQTDDQDLAPEVEGNAKNVVSHVKRQAQIWKPLLPKSAWAQAVGSLANVAAIKLIQDVADLDSLSVDAAESTARVIAEITTLDELFVVDGSDVPLTSQYADQWLKLQFLSQVLQSNQNDIRFMWFESDLSLYFSAEEVKDLIQLSFAENAGQRLLIKEILARPFPREIP